MHQINGIGHLIVILHGWLLLHSMLYTITSVRKSILQKLLYFWLGTTTNYTSYDVATSVSSVTFMDRISDHIGANYIKSIVLTEYTAVSHITSRSYADY